MRDYTYETVKVMTRTIMILVVALGGAMIMLTNSINNTASAADSVATRTQQNMPQVIITISPSTTSEKDNAQSDTITMTEQELHNMVMTIITEAKTTDAPITEPETTEEPETTVLETTKLAETTELVKSRVDVLAEKYSSVFSWQKYNGDFDKERLIYLADLCEIYNVPLELMLSLICAESGFDSTALNPSSTASGYCQVIQSTAEWIYEYLLNRGIYDVDKHRETMTTDWKLNLEIGCKLVQWLYTQNNENWSDTVCKYYGSASHTDNLRYLNKINSKMNELFGMSVSDLV